MTDTLLERLDAGGSEEQEAATMYVSVITCGGCGKAVTSAIPCNGKWLLADGARVECAECAGKAEAQFNARITAEHDLRQEENAAHSAEMDELEARLNIAESNVAALSARLLEASQDAARLQAQLAEANAADDEMERRCDQLRAALGEADTRAEAAEARLAEANGVIDANRWPDTAAKLLREAESRAEAADARAERWKTLAGQSAQSDFNAEIENKRPRAAPWPGAERPDDSDAGLVWPKNKVRQVKGKRGETRVRPPFVISDDDEQPEAAREEVDGTAQN